MSGPATRRQVALRAFSPRGGLERALLLRAVLGLIARTPLRQLGAARRLEAWTAGAVETLLVQPYAQWLERYQPVEAPSPAEADGIGTVAAVLQPGHSSALQLARCLRALRQQDRRAVRVLALAPTGLRRWRLLVAGWLAGERRLERVTSARDLAGRLEADSVLVLKGAPLLRWRALGVLAGVLARRPGAAAAYGDEDRLLGAGLGQPFFKPDHSPVLGRQYDFVGNVALFRRDFFCSRIVPDLDTGGLPAWLADPAMVVHVAEVLHAEPGRRRLSYVSGDAFDRSLAVAARRQSLPVVAIIIPTKDRAGLLRQCIESIFAITDYDRELLSVVVVDNGSSEPDASRLLRTLAADPAIAVIGRPGAFNYSRLCNDGAAAAGSAEILVFMNNDITVRDPEWLLKLVGAAALPAVGVVGCKLLYPDGRVQHAGVIAGLHGVAGHLGVGAGAEDGVYFGLAQHTREVAAVTGALVAIEADLFRQVGGYDERMAVAVSDFAMCLLCNDLGRQTLCLQSALAFHLESASRGPDDTRLKQERLMTECLHFVAERPELTIDPFYSPNLSLTKPYAMADPPRVVVRRAGERDRPVVLMLTSTFETGHAVATVVAYFAQGLEARGCTVLIGAPPGRRELAWPAERRIAVADPETAARLATWHEADVVMAHTPPFPDVFNLLPKHIATIAYHHGEAPPALFSDTADRRFIRSAMLVASCHADRVLAISEPVRQACKLPGCRVLAFGNRHMARWGDGSAARRRAARSLRGWTGQLVLLSVCRFGAEDREVEGVDALIALRRALDLLHPEIGALVQFVLAGWGEREDVAALVARGFTVVTDPSEERLVELHHAADLYLGLGRRPGYDLGIGQALALGVPVVASEIAAHQAAEVEVVGSLPAAVAATVRAFGDRVRRAEDGSGRVAVLDGERDALGRLRAEIDALLARKRGAVPEQAVELEAEEPAGAAHEGHALQHPA